MNVTALAHQNQKSAKLAAQQKSGPNGRRSTSKGEVSDIGRSLVQVQVNEFKRSQKNSQPIQVRAS